METITILEGRRILLGVSGSIASYKAVDLASKLTQAGALVDVILTDAAQKFVTPLTFQSVTGRAAYTNLWQTDMGGGLPTHIAHVGLGEGADLMLVAPATANTIAKLAGGFADDLISITAIAARCPVMIAPAMDGGMYESPAVQANLSTLRERGVDVIEPDSGRMASRLVGRGRLPETPALIGAIRARIGQDGVLARRHVVVTAGGTREPLDPVRFLTNRSSGKQGYAIAQAAIDAGARVTLITAARGLPAVAGAITIDVESASAMLDAVLTHTIDADALIMAAAVADFRPANVSVDKIKKQDDGAGLTIVLARNPDILQAVGARRHDSGSPRVLVGFAAESRNVAQYAQDKLARKGLDLIVANDITAADAGFEVNTNRVTIFDQEGGAQALDLTSKARVAEEVVGRVAALLTSKKG